MEKLNFRGMPDDRTPLQGYLNCLLAPLVQLFESLSLFLSVSEFDAIIPSWSTGNVISGLLSTCCLCQVRASQGWKKFRFRPSTLLNQYSNPNP